jgi:hypothetical protein
MRKLCAMSAIYDQEKAKQSLNGTQLSVNDSSTKPCFVFLL